MVSPGRFPELPGLAVGMPEPGAETSASHFLSWSRKQGAPSPSPSTSYYVLPYLVPLHHIQLIKRAPSRSVYQQVQLRYNRRAA